MPGICLWAAHPASGRGWSSQFVFVLFRIRPADPAPRSFNRSGGVRIHFVFWSFAFSHLRCGRFGLGGDAGILHPLLFRTPRDSTNYIGASNSTKIT